MGPVAIGFGLVMILIGVVGFFAGTTQSVTALIPAFFGVVFVILGALARNENIRKHVMHAAAGLALLGLIVPGVMGFPKLIQLFRGQDVERPHAAIAQSAMALVCGIFLILCVRSFVAARRSRQAQST
jgi:hypothetical protein